MLKEEAEKLIEEISDKISCLQRAQTYTREQMELLRIELREELSSLRQVLNLSRRQ